MRSSHPPALLKIVARTIADEHLYAPMALLHVLARLAPKLGIGVRACGVDHGLRPAAAGELNLAEQFATDLGVPFTSVKIDQRPVRTAAHAPLARARRARARGDRRRPSSHARA